MMAFKKRFDYFESYVLMVERVVNSEKFSEMEIALRREDYAYQKAEQYISDCCIWKRRKMEKLISAHNSLITSCRDKVTSFQAKFDNTYEETGRCTDNAPSRDLVEMTKRILLYVYAN